MDSSSACGLCFWLPHGSSSSSQSPFPKAQTQENQKFLGLWVQEPGGSLAGGLSWLCLCIWFTLRPGWALPSLL